MIKAIIIEDEKQVKEALIKMLQFLFPDLEILCTASGIQSAKTCIENHQADLIFLDIQLKNGTAFDLLPEIDFASYQIIFTTAYNQYAVKAFKYSAVDYLLKPIDPLELKTAVNRALQNINKEQRYQEALSVLQHNLGHPQQPKIVLKTASQRYIIHTADIIRLEADGAYTLFVTPDDKILASRNLKYYQNLLGNDFFRCHQSHLVNRRFIKILDNKDMLHLANGEQIPVSKRLKQKLLEWL